MSQIDQRLIELEIKLAYQEDLVNDLNNVVIQQQQKISDLEKICQLLYERLAALASLQADSVIDEPPPHY